MLGFLNYVKIVISMKNCSLDGILVVNIKIEPMYNI